MRLQRVHRTAAPPLIRLQVFGGGRLAGPGAAKELDVDGGRRGERCLEFLCARELLGLIDRKFANPALDTSAFSGQPPARFGAPPR